MLCMHGHYIVMVNNMQARKRDGESLCTDKYYRGRIGSVVNVEAGVGNFFVRELVRVGD